MTTHPATPPPASPAPSGTASGSSPASGFRRRLLAIAATLACLGSLSLAIDLPVARWFKTHRLPSDARRLLDFAEVFAHGSGVAVILLAAAVLDPGLAAARSRGGGAPSLRRLFATPLPAMIAAAYGGGLVVDLLKALIDRVRPRAADLFGAPSALATFGEQAAAWAREQGVTSAADFNSFPSGHSATAAGLAAALAWRYPRGAWLFAALAAMGALQRVVSLAHYPSDACLGAALGVCVAALVLRDRPGDLPAAAGPAA